MSAATYWQHAANAFWFWWVPVLILSAAGFWYMAQLSAAHTASGVLSRLFLLAGFVFMIASFVYDWCGWGGHSGLSRVGCLLLMAGIVLVIRQFAEGCRRVRQSTPSKERFGERVLALLVDE